MGLLLSVVISYVGFHEALECMKHIISGIIPDTDPDFNDLVEYYTRLLQKTANTPSPRDWTSECGQGYLCLTEDKHGILKSAAVKFYERQPNSTAILFSTKISSFGQDSLDESSQANGDYRIERIPTKTKTIITDSSESFSVGQKNRSTSSEHIPDESEGINKEKLTWEYRPKTPSPSPLPEILFQPYSSDKNGDVAYSEEFLRSLDGIKFRPLQRSDPSFRRRSFRKRASSSSNSSRESRASREEELKMFTSLEEAEFKNMNRDQNYSGFGSAPNLAARSYSRSRSREKSRERRNESPILEANVDNKIDERLSAAKLKDVPKLSSLERDESKEMPEVKEEEEDVDFWANLGD
ncbi:unnamed protein product [Euphydryas editha]|uniref:Uncharacterized protein n=1 Tax=Euphydryas editha TaxID=104508 RepID=A0AAU9V683_EUPED|nr:unnamed protein product [Euphydryas editha]